MDYKCPHCPASYTVSENYYRGGQIFSCTSCNRESVIPLYCPTCYPRTTATKSWLVTPEGLLGGRNFRCPQGHSFTVPVTLAEAHRKLKELGTEVGQYHQSNRIATLRDGETRQAVSGGYCSGACYDWIRRVLVSHTPKLTYRNLESTMPRTGALAGEFAAQHNQDIRAAHLQQQDVNPLIAQKETARVAQFNTWQNTRSQQKSTAEDAAYQTYLREHNARHQQYQTDRNAAFQTYSHEVDRINTLSGVNRQQLADQARRAYNNALAVLERVYNADRTAHNTYQGTLSTLQSGFDTDVRQRRDILDRERAVPMMQQIWAEFRAQMDQAIRTQREGGGKTGLSARPFENLDIIASSDSAEYRGGLQDLIDAILNHTSFSPGFCAHVGVNPPGGGTGHAVAIHRQNTGGRYHLFDPNFGVYDFSRENLRQAFVYIFRVAYPFWAGGGTSDDHPYEVNGRTLGSFSIFRGTRVSAPPPSVVETRPPQTTSLAPIVTSLQTATTQPVVPVPTRQSSEPPVTGTRTTASAQQGTGGGTPQNQPRSGGGGGAWVNVGGRWVRQ